MSKRLKTIFSGTVQGVGFRASIHQLSRGFQIAGHVRNLPNGTVELIVEGEESELKTFIKTILESHLADFIRHWNTEWSDGRNEFREFRIA